MKIYVGTYAKYNNGDLTGKWLELDDYADHGEFIKACAELHTDEEDPEFMFQDSENVPDSMISETDVDEDLWDMMGLEKQYDIDAMVGFAEHDGGWDRERFENAYQGEFIGWTEFAEQMVDELGYLDDAPDFLKTYFDYEKFGRDLQYDYFEAEGYCFRRT